MALRDLTGDLTSLFLKIKSTKIIQVKKPQKLTCSSDFVTKELLF